MNIFKISKEIEGNNAFMIGKTRSSNPYPQFSFNYLEWNKGWNSMKARWVKEKLAEKNEKVT